MTTSSEMLELRHIDAIKRHGDGYRIEPDSVTAIGTYLARHSIRLDTLKTHAALIDALRFCNSQDFERIMAKPAPEPRLQFIWNRLRKIGQSA